LNVVLETIKETFTPAPAAPAAGSHEASEDEAKKKSILGRIIQGVKETVLGESHLQPGGQRLEEGGPEELPDLKIQPPTEPPAPSPFPPVTELVVEPVKVLQEKIEIAEKQKDILQHAIFEPACILASTEFETKVVFPPMKANFKPLVVATPFIPEVEPAFQCGVATETVQVSHAEIHSEYEEIKDEKMDRDRASDIIQRAVKRYMFRSRLRKAKTGKATMDRERAGVEIHNAAKRYLFRSNLSYRKVEKKAGADTKEKERLASLVGAAACSWLAKKDFRSSRKSQSKGWNNDKDRLASQIGAASRTWLAKQKLSSSSFKETKPKEKRGKENVRPEVIQSAARGYLAKQQLKRTGKSENVSDPAKVPEILKMVEVVEKALENIDESQLPKATKADLFTPSSQEPAPSQRLHPLPTVDARPNVATGNTQSRFQPERSSN
jgi:hypothetical protein